MTKRVVCIQILGQEYRIRSDADEEALQRVGRLVDAAMAQIRARTGTVDTLDVAILTSLNLARELLSLRENAREPDPSGVEPERLRALIERVESALVEATSPGARAPLLTLPAGRELDEVADDLLAPLIGETEADASSLQR